MAQLSAEAAALSREKQRQLSMRQDKENEAEEEYQRLRSVASGRANAVSAAQVVQPAAKSEVSSKVANYLT